jgi:O-antigen/teichoic acid export membrane protein
MNTITRRIKEKWQHAGFQKYLEGIGWLFFSRVLGMAISFFVTAMVARYLGPAKYGTLSYATSFVMLFSFISSLGIDQILYRDIIKNPERENELFGTAFILKSIGGFIAVAVTIGISFFFSHDLLEQKLIFIISLSYIFQSFNILTYGFQARRENKRLSQITIAVSIMLSLLKVAIVFLNKGVLFLGVVLVIEPILYALLLGLYYSKISKGIQKWTFKKDTAKKMIVAAAPLMLSSIFVILYSRIDQVLLKNYINTEAVGLYSAAVTLSEVWYFIPNIIVSTLFPAIIAAQMTDIRLYSKRILKLALFLTCISSCIALAGTIFAKQALWLIFGPDFVTGYKVLQLYIWSGVGISLGTIIIQYLIAEKLSSIILYTSIIGMILNISLNLLLIGRYGINGSAFATLISYTLGPLSVLCFKEPRNKIIHLFKS